MLLPERDKRIRSVDMKHFLPQKETFILILLSSFLFAACNRTVEATPQATQIPARPPVEITYCDIDQADLCLEGFGLDAEERLLILFKTDDPLYADVYIRAVGPDGEMLFECQQSENFPENVYCLGDTFPEGERIKLNFYSKSNNNFIAIGVFNVTYSGLPEPDVVFTVDATATHPPEPAAPAPTEPPSAYPNPSYSNPTFTP